MKKIYILLITCLAPITWCRENNFPSPIRQQEVIRPTSITQFHRPSQREFAKEALLLRFSAGPVLAAQTSLISYATKRGNYKFTFSGYIKSDFWWDSWQVRGSGQDQVLLYPEQPVYDQCGYDTNHNGRFNMVSVETRLRTEIEGPKVFGARPFGVIEVDFRGGDLVDFIQIAHMVHGHIYLDWGDKSLLIGQYFHPTFPAEYKCYPEPVSYNYGLSIDDYCFEPQIRITKQLGMMAFQLTFASDSSRFYGGPLARSSLYVRNAIMPNINFLSVASIGAHRLGIGIDMVRLVPRIRTRLALPAGQSLKTSESIISFLALTFLVLDYESIKIKFKAFWSQNGSGYALTSGYGVQCVDSLTDVRNYINTQIVNAWMDVTFKNVMPFEPGYFLGISKTLGAGGQLVPSISGVASVYTPGNRHLMAYLFRFSPRLRWYARPFVLGTELEFTRALWGQINNYARVVNASPVNNLRLLFGAYYYF